MYGHMWQLPLGIVVGRQWWTVWPPLIYNKEYATYVRCMHIYFIASCGMLSIDLIELRAISHGLPSPIHGGKVLTLDPQETIKLWITVIKVESWLLYGKISQGLRLRVGSNFFLNPTLNTCSKPHLQKVLPRRHPCHAWDLGLGTPCEVVSPNFHALNG